MGWAVLVVALIVLAGWVSASSRSTSSRRNRNGRLEDAFVRARVQRMTANGIRGGR